MLTLESRRFSVSGEVSCFVRNLPITKETEQGVLITMYILCSGFFSKTLSWVFWTLSLAKKAYIDKVRFKHPL